MQSVSIGSITYQTDRDVASVAARVSVPGREFDIGFQVAGCPIYPGPESFLAVTLLTAMKLGLPVELPGPVSSRLMQQLPTIQSIFRIWRRDPYHYSTATFTPITPRPAATAPHPQPKATGVAAFFSCGVDSFYTLLRQMDSITHLIHIRGFELPSQAADHHIDDSVAAAARRVAAYYGKTLIQVTTNVRSMTDHYVSEQFNHGTLLAAVAYLLSPTIGTVYIPSTHDYSQLFPWGSHPILDPLWSTEATTIIHDGCDALRLEKTAVIAKHEVALRHLRVCWGGEYNCGACNKCVRTIISLQALGALERCTIFKRGPFMPAEVARLPPMGEHNACYFAEIADFLEHSGSNPELARALRDALANKYYHGLGRVLRGNLRERTVRRLKAAVAGLTYVPRLDLA